MNYSIKKALACRRWDLIVNGVTIVSRDSKVELNEFIYKWILNGFLKDEIPS